jgi:acyl-CoA synthetase (AMP-forming)/AMP-acid ligase II
MSYSALLLRDALRRAAGRPILFDTDGHSRSADGLVAGVDRLAGALAASVGASARVGLWYRNSVAAIEAFLAVEWIGGTRIPVDPEASAEEAQSVFRAAKVDTVLADREHAALIGSDAIVHDDSEPLAGPPRDPVADVDPERSLMIYPRGVTGGELHGIPLSYRNWAAIMDTNVALYRSGRYGRWNESSEVYLTAQQIMHGTGFLGTFPFLAMGLPQVLIGRFEATSMVAAMARHAVTGTMLVPAMLRGVVAAIRPDHGLKLRHVLYGGGPTSPEDVIAAIDLLGPVLTQVYGRVEGGWPLAILGTADHALLRKERPDLIRTFGRPIAEVETRLRPLGDDHSARGELVVRSAMTSRDYADAGGWCSLGDVVRRDNDGYLTYERRLDRMINTGYHVYPEEIEAVIAGIDGVAQTRVVGEPHPRWSQMVVAYIVARDNAVERALSAMLPQAVASRLARYKVPREFRMVTELPPL